VTPTRPAGTFVCGWAASPHAITVPAGTAGAVGVGTAVGTAVGVAAATLGAGVAVATAADVGGTLAVVGAAPPEEHAATVASNAAVRAAVAIPGMALGCPIIWTPRMGTPGEPSRSDTPGPA